MVACEATGIAVFLATIDSVSAPCGLMGEYWDAGGGNHLQNMDATNTMLRGVMLVAMIVHAAINVPAKEAHTGYAALAVYLFISTVISGFDAMGLDCPNADNLMGCTEPATFWMVPRNYCRQHIDNAQCLGTVDDADRVQMCVRLGRAPMVNGALAAWFMRTLLVDSVRLVVVAACWAGVLGVVDDAKTGDSSDAPVKVEAASARRSRRTMSRVESDDGGDSGSGPASVVQGPRSVPGTTILRPPSTLLHERDTLLAGHSARDDVIRQSPHVRKRAASAYKIDF